MTMEDSGLVRGTVADGFEGVRHAFERNFTDHGDIGAGVAVYVDGECVVDLVGGDADDTGRPYDDDTLQLVFSSTKGVAAIVAHLLAQRGELDLDARVADLWPEFAAEGKQDATVAMVLSHRIGLPEQESHRVAPLVAMRPEEASFDPSALDPEIAPLLGDLASAFLDPESILNRSLHLNGAFTEGGMSWNRPEVWASQIPAANGITTARSLAKLYAATVSEVDGIRLLDDDTVARATEEHSSGRDHTLVVPTRFGLGFFLPSTFSPLMGESSFGHAGAGGSLGFAHAGRRVGFGYVMRKMSANLSNDPRTAGLIDALRAALGA